MAASKKRRLSGKGILLIILALLLLIIGRPAGFLINLPETLTRKPYPGATNFFELKKQYDPGEIFSNRFYEKYQQEQYNKSPHR